MKRLAARWLLGPLITLLVSSFALYALLSLAPGDPVARRLGPHANRAQAAALRHQLGLDHPLPVRYWDWLSGAVHGDFGNSLVYQTGVSSLLGARLATTLILVLYASLLVVVVGLGLGILGTVARPLGPVVAAVSGLGIAIPSYVAASLLVTVFALDLNWFPALGAGSGFGDRIWHLTLPAVALAIGWSAYVTQISAAALREERGREHVETAIGRGLPTATVFRRHVLRNAGIPIITVSGLTVAGLFAGTVVVESAFGIDGVGSFLVSAVSAKDYNVVQAIGLMLVAVFVVVTTLIDVLHVMLDPRLRTKEARV
jgi:peptide/nickel transport system permease protein